MLNYVCRRFSVSHVLLDYFSLFEVHSAQHNPIRRENYQVEFAYSSLLKCLRNG